MESREEWYDSEHGQIEAVDQNVRLQERIGRRVQEECEGRERVRKEWKQKRLKRLCKKLRQR